MRVQGVFRGAQETRTYAPGDVVFREGDAGHHMYGVISGRIEVRKGATSHDGSGAPTYTCVISIWIADWAAYEKAMAVRASELIAEVPLFTKVMPVMQIDEVIF